MLYASVRMTYDTSATVRSPRYLSVDVIPKKPKQPLSRRIAVATVTGVFVVVMAGIAGAAYFSSVSPNHTDIVSESVISDLSGEKTSVIPWEYHQWYSSVSPAFGSAAIFRPCTGSCFILIHSLEFYNESSADLYVSEIHSGIIYDLEENNVLVSETNGTYGGFNYSTIVYDWDGSYNLFTIGSSGRYVFNIVDSNIPLSDVTALIHEQIKAMTD